MTLKTRSIFLLIGIITSFFLLAVLGFIAYELFPHEFRISLKYFSQETGFFSLRLEPEENHLFFMFIGFSVEVLFAFISGIIYRKYFRRIPAPEMFLFTCFLLFLSFDALRMLQILVELWNYPVYFGVVLSRGVYFGHFAGIFCLFAGSILVAGVEYQKLGGMFGIIIFIALLIAYTIPIDSSVLYAGYMHKAGSGVLVPVLTVSVLFFTLINHVYGTVSFGSRDSYLLVPAIFLVAAGKFLVFSIPHLLAVGSGCICLIIGTVMYGKRNFTLYLWT
jgi:hypothetical protein